MVASVATPEAADRRPGQPDDEGRDFPEGRKLVEGVSRHPGHTDRATPCSKTQVGPARRPTPLIKLAQVKGRFSGDKDAASVAFAQAVAEAECRGAGPVVFAEPA